MKKFNKNKYLRKLELKRLFRKYERYFYIGIPCFLVCILGIYFAYSKFSASKDEEVVRTTVEDFISGDVVIGAYIDGEYSKTIPGKDDGYTVEKIECDNDAVGKWDTAEWGLLTKNLTTRSKCNVYFKEYSPVDNVIAQLDTSGKCPTVNDDGAVNVTGVEATDGYLCKAKDAYGDSYYYRGNVTNNYVKFANFYWRIVRINGDGSVRIIYDGTTAHKNGESSTDRQIGTSAFNDGYSSEDKVGYMYGTSYANMNDSLIKKYIDDWYKVNIFNTLYEQYLADNIFCSDRLVIQENQGRAGSSSDIRYRWWYGPWDGAGYGNASMKLVCPQQNDAFTVNDTTYGNGSLKYPIGILSSDETVLSGGWNVNNVNYYLYSGQNWWVSSTEEAGEAYVYNYAVNSNGNADYVNIVNSTYGVRPVINLKMKALRLGTGTMDDPYRMTE